MGRRFLSNDTRYGSEKSFWISDFGLDWIWTIGVIASYYTTQYIMGWHWREEEIFLDCTHFPTMGGWTDHTSHTLHYFSLKALPLPSKVEWEAGRHRPLSNSKK
jgi:hypothetical protein